MTATTRYFDIKVYDPQTGEVYTVRKVDYSNSISFTMTNRSLISFDPVLPANRIPNITYKHTYLENTNIDFNPAFLITSPESKTLGHYFLTDNIPLNSQKILNQVPSTQSRTEPIKGYKIPAPGAPAGLMADILNQGLLLMSFPEFDAGYQQHYYEVPEFSIGSVNFQDTKIYTFSIQLEILNSSSGGLFCQTSGLPSDFKI